MKLNKKVKFILFFVVVFVGSFGVLNIRFLAVSAKYYFKKADFINAHPSARLLPIADTKIAKPLPNEATLVVDAINVFAPIVFGQGSNPDVIYKNLEKGVVHYDETAKPGQGGGASIILGHSSAFPWYRGKYGAVFALLGKLKLGDKILVQYSDGRTFTYVVKDTLIFSPFDKDSPELKAIEQSQRSSIILVSCWPVGTNYRRIAVRAELI